MDSEHVQLQQLNIVFQIMYIQTSGIENIVNFAALISEELCSQIVLMGYPKHYQFLYWGALVRTLNHIITKYTFLSIT